MRRKAVVDLGSNSVRLVVFEGDGRNPVTVFNEKAVLRLGRGLQATGKLPQAAMTQAYTVLSRYHAVARAMGAEVFEILATAAVRDAENGSVFADTIRGLLPGVTLRILTGEEEAALAAEGVLCGIPAAGGVMADIGGGSLELVPLEAGLAGAARTLKLGVIRLAERSGNDLTRARAIAESDMASVEFLPQAAGRDLYLVGGAWRALARIHMAQIGYPLGLVHHYTIRHEEARDLASVIAGACKRALERLPGIPRRRIDDLPYAAIVLRRLLRLTAARRVVFCANGMREGWYLRQVTETVRREDPLLAASKDYAFRLGRDYAMGPALFGWTAALFAHESAEARRLREAACWLADIGSHDHPEYRTEQAFYRVLRQPGVGLDHHARAFLALTIALRYEAEPDAPFLMPARLLLDVASAHRAEVLGTALRLGFTLSAGTASLLAGTSLSLINQRLILRLETNGGVFAGEAIMRRLDRVAQALGLEGETEIVADGERPVL
jgi:exopolyphosphatase/guanosine-5'-triphosphate,3'-diphosphate pyrophosphatase